MWFVHKEVILTKDNLAKRNWPGNKSCGFYNQLETIKHLFLECPLAKILWTSIHISFNIAPPTSIQTLFGTWLDGVDINVARQIRLGVCALLWAIWNCRNDMVFNRIYKPIFCRFYTGQLLSSVHGPYSLLRRTGSVWLLDIPDGRW